MNMHQKAGLAVAVLYILFWAAAAAVAIYLLVLIIKALRKYLASQEVRQEKAQIKRSLAEVLRENRIRCKMTQEFVSETLGVSRQAVSKWENGSSDPSTSNLIALSRLYGVPTEDLLRGVSQGAPETDSEEKK